MPGGYVGGRPKDESKLSTKPSQIRNRLRRTAKKQDEVFRRDLAMLMEHDDRYKPMEEWDVEELAHGRPRDKNGTFIGKTPAWITAEVAKEAKRRLLEYTYAELHGHVDQAIKTMANLMVSKEIDENGKPIVDARTKFAAAAFILEHMLGKPKAILDVTVAEDKVRAAIASAIILDDGKPQGHHDVVEGEIVEGEVDDDDE